MVENFRSLGLEEDYVRRLQRVSAGFGSAYLHVAESERNRRSRDLQLLAAATNFRRAGAHALLLGEGPDAQRYFHKAGTVYLGAGSLYGFFLQNFSPKEAGSMHDLDAAGPRRASDVFWLWNSVHFDESAGHGRERLSMFRKRLEGYRTETVGVLGMTVATQLDLFDALMGASEAAVARASFPIVAAYSAAIGRAREDRYHWKRLATPFHPVEPDVIGILLAASRALGAGKQSLARMLAAMPVSDDAGALLRGSLGQFGAWEDGEMTTEET